MTDDSESPWLLSGRNRSLAISGSRITSEIDVSTQVDVRALDLYPGFVDQHCHGGGGGTFSTTDASEVATAIHFHRDRGTTSIMASLLSAPTSELISQIKTLMPFVDSQELIGIHLEGPWISPRFAGAHDLDSLRGPTTEELRALLDTAQGAIRMVTLAPELPGALDAIAQLVAADVTVAIGHTACNPEQARAAVDRGASVVTHAFNAMPGVHHRDPGPLPWLLARDTVFVELIADGLHVHPDVLRLTTRAVGERRVIAVTDAMAAAGCRDGEYRLGDQRVLVKDGAARLFDKATLAGSTLTMEAAVRFFSSQCAVTLDEAVAFATRNPAAALSLRDRGSLDAGMRADVVGIDSQGYVQLVVYGGTVLTSSA